MAAEADGGGPSGPGGSKDAATGEWGPPLDTACGPAIDTGTAPVVAAIGGCDVPLGDGACIAADAAAGKGAGVVVWVPATEDSGAGALACMTPCSATADGDDADADGRTEPACDIPPAPDPDNDDAEPPSAAIEPADDHGPVPVRQAPLLPISATAAPYAGPVPCAESCDDTEEEPGVGPVLTLGALLPDDRLASGGSGAE